VNDRIRAPQVRLVGADGSQIGIVSIQDALRRAQDLDLDLVEVAPQAAPPVCRIMDYGKFKYERDVRQKEARKRQVRVEVKEMKMRPKIDPHDYATKKGHIVRFLNQGAKVKVTIMFRGREMAHTELGRKLLDRLTADLSELATVETYPKLDGRNMTMVVAPVKRQAARVEQRQDSGARTAPQAPEAEEVEVEEVAAVEPADVAEPDEPEPASAPQGEGAEPDAVGDGEGKG
jgi:translation initiation factor IF-3